MSLQSLEFLLCHVWHLSIPLTRLVAYCILISSWVTLGLICRLTIFLVGQRILFMVMVFSLKSRTLPISCKVCLSINQVVQRCLRSYFVLHMSGVSFTDLLAEYSIRMCQLHPPFCLKGAFEVPHDRAAYPSSWQVCTFDFWDPFLIKRRSLLDALSSSTLSPLLASSNAPAEPFQMLFRSIQSLFLRIQPFIWLI